MDTVFVILELYCKLPIDHASHTNLGQDMEHFASTKDSWPGYSALLSLMKTKLYDTRRIFSKSKEEENARNDVRTVFFSTLRVHVVTS